MGGKVSRQVAWNLVAILHGQLAKGLEVALPDAAGHLGHARRHPVPLPGTVRQTASL